jgi:hypothetical protein
MYFRDDSTAHMDIISDYPLEYCPSSSGQVSTLLAEAIFSPSTIIDISNKLRYNPQI